MDQDQDTTTRPDGLAASPPPSGYWWDGEKWTDRDPAPEAAARWQPADPPACSPYDYSATDEAGYGGPDIIECREGHRDCPEPGHFDQAEEPGVCKTCGGFGSGTPAGCPGCGNTGLPKADPERAAYTAGLRQLADTLDGHPELPLPYEGRTGPMTIHFLSAADPRAALAAAARALPVPLAKKFRDYGEDGSYLDLAGQLAGLKIELTAYRDDVCTRRVTGTEDREVEETVTPAVTRTVTRPVEIVEWDCHPILAAGSPA